MIARTWRGSTNSANAAKYAEYVRETGIAGYLATPGNLGAHVLFRLQEDRAEFLVLSFWESIDSVRAFAGDPYDRAVFYPQDEAFLIERDVTAFHWLVG